MGGGGGWDGFCGGVSFDFLDLKHDLFGKCKVSQRKHLQEILHEVNLERCWESSLSVFKED